MTKNNDKGNNSDDNNRGKGVHFAPDTKKPNTAKGTGVARSLLRNPNKEHDERQAAASIAATAAGGDVPAAVMGSRRRQKRPRPERPNEDEMDDIDDWKPEDDDDDEAEVVGGGDGAAATVLPSEHDLLELKRKRRLKRQKETKELGIDDEDEEEKHVNDWGASLAEEGITVEPFNMEQEKNDGTGYFDGDTYVFRSRLADEEPDAWLESLDEQMKQQKQQQQADSDSEDDDDHKNGKKRPSQNAKEQKKATAAQSGSGMDDMTKTEIYALILPLVSDTETIMQAIARYGKLMQRKTFIKKQQPASQQQPQPTQQPASNETNSSMAQKAMNDLTEAASALLLKGDTDIYQRTRRDIQALLPQPSTNDDSNAAETNAETNVNTKNNSVQWEYKGLDGQIHGPFSTENMRAWTKGGYFVGAYTVTVRTIEPQQQEKQSLQDDLLSDLADDDDAADETTNKSLPNVKHGEWMSSDQVDFDQYE